MVIDQDGTNLGVMSTSDANILAEDAGLNLVEVSPQARPPVCRIIDYGRFKYDQSKREKQRKAKTFEPKTIKLNAKTDRADFARKAKDADEFLSKGHPVNVQLRMRGRENAHSDLNVDKVNDFLSMIECGTVTRHPVREGRIISASIQPTKKVE